MFLFIGDFPLTTYMQRVGLHKASGLVTEAMLDEDDNIPMSEEE
jgi:hypothetical protein